MNICEIRRFINKLTKRSVKQNIREGYSKGSLGTYINSIRISLGSLEELSGEGEKEIVFCNVI